MKWECKYCKRELVLKNKYTKTGHLARCSAWKSWADSHITKDFLEQKYVLEKKSLPEIAKELELDSVSSIHKRLKQFSLPIRSVSSSWEISNHKRIRTNNERYGSDSILYRNHPKRLEFESKILEKYGVLNVFQMESVKEKIRQFYLDGYGVTSAVLVPEIRAKQKATLKANYGVDSPLQLAKERKNSNFTKPHKQVVELLNRLGFSPKIEKYLLIKDKAYFFDIYFDGSNKLIEVNGDYFHANPKIYKSTDIISFFDEPASFLWKKDSLKSKAVQSIGYDLLVIWESDLKKDFANVTNKLLEFLK